MALLADDGFGAAALAPMPMPSGGARVSPKARRRAAAQHVPLPLSLALRLVKDDSFRPGGRPEQLCDLANTWVFKETRRVKRKAGCDAWVNSGGVRGGRNLQNMEGEIVLRRRYGKVLASADGGRRAKLTGDERRYQEYTLLSKGPDGELQENRDIRLCVSPSPLQSKSPRRPSLPGSESFRAAGIMCNRRWMLFGSGSRTTSC